MKVSTICHESCNDSKIVYSECEYFDVCILVTHCIQSTSSRLTPILWSPNCPYSVTFRPPLFSRRLWSSVSGKIAAGRLALQHQQIKIKKPSNYLSASPTSKFEHSKLNTTTLWACHRYYKDPKIKNKSADSSIMKLILCCQNTLPLKAGRHAQGSPAVDGLIALHHYQVHQVPWRRPVLGGQ